MDEKILLRFQNGNAPMRVVSFDPAQGAAFQEPVDASPLILSIGIQPLLPGQLDAVRLRHDWRNKEFNLDAVLQDGGIQLSGHAGDRNGLPPGPYDITVELESYRLRNPWNRVVIEKGKTVEIALRIQPDRRKVRLLGNFDAATAALLSSSSADGTTAGEWLSGQNAREVRKACLLNLLTKFAAAPMPSSPVAALNQRLQSVYFADVDRIYASAKREIVSDLEKLAAKKGWNDEGNPKAPIHRRLISDAIQRFPQDLAGVADRDFELRSFRQGGRNSLQICVAVPPGNRKIVYLDADIDLGNPLWDLEGLFVHMGELMDGGPTDHFAIHPKLKQSAETSDFVFYRIVS